MIFGLSSLLVAYLVIGAIISVMEPSTARVVGGGLGTASNSGVLNFALSTLTWPVGAYSWATGSVSPI
jgi:hypothetical protein